MSNKNKLQIPASLSLFIVTVIVLIFVASSVFGFYWFNFLPKQVATNVNSNIEIDNKFSQKIIYLNQQTQKQAQNLNKLKNKNSEEVRVLLGDLSNLKKDTQTLSQELLETKKTLNKGPNKDSEELYNLIIQKMDTTAQNLKVLDTVIDFNTCLSTKNYENLVLNKDLEEIDKTFETELNNGELLQYLIKYKAFQGQMLANVSSEQKCFEGGLEIFKDNSVGRDIQKAQTIFQDYQQVLDGFGAAITSKDLDKVRESNQKFQELEALPISSFGESRLQDFANSMAKTVEIEVQKTLEITKKIDQKTAEIATKYNLQ